MYGAPGIPIWKCSLFLLVLVGVLFLVLYVTVVAPRSEEARFRQRLKDSGKRAVEPNELEARYQARKGKGKAVLSFYIDTWRWSKICRRLGIETAFESDDPEVIRQFEEEVFTLVRESRMPLFEPFTRITKQYGVIPAVTMYLKEELDEESRKPLILLYAHVDCKPKRFEIDFFGPGGLRPITRARRKRLFHGLADALEPTDPKHAQAFREYGNMTAP